MPQPRMYGDARRVKVPIQGMAFPRIDRQYIDEVAILPGGNLPPTGSTGSSRSTRSTDSTGSGQVTDTSTQLQQRRLSEGEQQRMAGILVEQIDHGVWVVTGGDFLAGDGRSAQQRGNGWIQFDRIQRLPLFGQGQCPADRLIAQLRVG